MQRLIPTLKDPTAYRALTERLNIAVYVQNSEGEIIDANRLFLRMFGATSIDAFPATPQDLLAQLQPFAKRLDLQKKDSVVRRVLLTDPESGEQITYLDICYSEEDADSGETHYTGLLIPTVEEKVYTTEIEKQNLRDHLTGSFNRQYLKVFETESGNQVYGCILFTMDRLWRFSEKFGEAATQEAICKMSRFILRFVRVQDSVVRLNEEQFLLLIKCDEGTLHKVNRRLRNLALNQAPLSFSMGAAIRKSGESLEQVIFRANRELSAVKVMERLPRRFAG